jgi:membrane protein implicated in regulation of membrane protease activity
MTTSKLVKTIIFVALLVAASIYLGNVGRQIGQLGDAIFVLSIDTWYPFIWLLLALVLVAISAGLVAALVRPLWICFIAFALGSLALLLIWGLNMLGIVLAVLYLLAGLLYCRGVANGLNERIKFSVGPIKDNQNVLAIVMIIAACALFYFGYAAQIEREGFTTPPFIIDMPTRIVEEQIERIPGLTPQEKERAIAEFRQSFEQHVTHLIKPYQKFIPAGVALMLLGLLTTVVGLFSWLPTLILKAIFAILTACHVTSVVTEMQEVKRLTID